MFSLLMRFFLWGEQKLLRLPFAIVIFSILQAGFTAGDYYQRLSIGNAGGLIMLPAFSAYEAVQNHS